MKIDDLILKTKGTWKIIYKDNYKIVVDLDNMMFDTLEWYKAVGILEQELTNEKLNNLFKNTVECQKIK